MSHTFPFNKQFESFFCSIPDDTRRGNLCSLSVFNLIGIRWVSASFESVHWMLPSGKAIIISTPSLCCSRLCFFSKSALDKKKKKTHTPTMDLIGAVFTSLMIKCFWITNNLCSVCHWLYFWVIITASKRNKNALPAINTCKMYV